MRLLDRLIRYFRRLRSKFRRRGAQSLDLAKMHVFSSRLSGTGCSICGLERHHPEHLWPDASVTLRALLDYQTGLVPGSLTALASAVFVVDAEAELYEEFGRFPYIVFVRLSDLALLEEVRLAAWRYKPIGVLMVVYGAGEFSYTQEEQAAWLGL
jgi:hypothetical protein